MKRWHLMRLVYFFSALLLALLLTSCGGGGSSAKVDSADVAVVGDQHISKTAFEQSLDQQKASLKSQGRAFPKAGSTDYAALRTQVLSVLIQNAEFESEAKKLGVTVTDKDVQSQLDTIKKQYFGGSEKKYEQELKKQGYTDEAVRRQIRVQLLSQRIFDKVTADVKASDKDVHAYYVAHKDQYTTKASRDVRYILVGKNKASLAHSLATQLENAPDKTWCTDAKKYSQDPSSKDSCGKANFQQGQTVPEFDKLLFSLKPKTVGVTNSSQYGWFVLEPTSATKPAGTQSEKEVAETIRAQLEQQDRNQAMTDWVSKIAKSFCSGGKIKYQAGYEPNPDPCAALETATNTTTT